jgi:hypothetical protein
MFLENGHFASCPERDFAVIRRGAHYFVYRDKWTDVPEHARVFTRAAATVAAEQLGEGAEVIRVVDDDTQDNTEPRALRLRNTKTKRTRT